MLIATDSLRRKYPLWCPPYISRRPPPPISTLFPYTTLFRSRALLVRRRRRFAFMGGAGLIAVGAAGALLLTSPAPVKHRSEEHTSELQSQSNLVCRLRLEKNKRSTPRQSRLPTRCCSS